MGNTAASCTANGAGKHAVVLSLTDAAYGRTLLPATDAESISMNKVITFPIASQDKLS